MIKDIIKIKCDIFPKVKYRLYINNWQIYFFVTTRYSEDDCISLMMEKVKSHYSSTMDKSYKIVKVVDGKEIILKKGKI